MGPAVVGAILGCALLAGCRPQAPAATGSAERSAPPATALAWVPKDAAYVLFTENLESASGALSRALSPLFSLAAAAGSPGGAALRDLFGAESGALAGTLRDVGLDMGASAALFGEPAMPTFAARVADAAALEAHLEEKAAAQGLAIERVGESEVHFLLLPDGRLSWAIVDGWWLVHYESGAEAPGWRPPGRANALAATEVWRATAAWAEDLSSPPPPLWGFARPTLLARELGTELSADERRCADAVGAAAPLARVAVGTSGDSGRIHASLSLSPEAAASVRGALSKPPPPGFAAYRERAPASAAVGVDLAWLAPRARRCGLIDLAAPFAAAGWTPPPEGVFAALEALDLERVEGRLALYLPLRDSSFIRRQLGRIPARAFFESGETVAGVEVRRLSVPGAPTLHYLLAADEFVVGLGAGVMGEVLGKSAAPVRSGEVVAAALEAPRIVNLRQLLGQLESVLGPFPSAAIAAELQRHSRLSLRVTLVGDKLDFETDVRAAPR